MTIRLSKNSLAAAAHELAARDGDLTLLLDKNGVPPLWSRKPGFQTLVYIILEQQVSLASAKAMFKRLLERIVPFTPERFIELGDTSLRSFGVTRQKARYCINLAEAVCDGTLNLKRLNRCTDEEVSESLRKIKGIGYWTAEVYLLMALLRPDIWPVGDIALQTSVRHVKRLRLQPSPDKLVRLARDWRPYRSVAARLLWHHYLNEGLSRRAR